VNRIEKWCSTEITKEIDDLFGITKTLCLSCENASWMRKERENTTKGTDNKISMKKVIRIVAHCDFFARDVHEWVFNNDTVRRDEKLYWGLTQPKERDAGKEVDWAAMVECSQFKKEA